MVSETLDHAAEKPRRYVEHMTNSAELLTQTQGNIVLDTAGDQYDQTSELRLMEIQMESLKLAKLNSMAFSSQDDKGTLNYPPSA